MFRNKKADGGVVAVVIILIIILLLIWFAYAGQRECRRDRDCGKDSYCGSDFSCHAHPTITRTITQVDYTKPALIIGAAIIIAVFLFKFSRRPEKETKDAQSIESKPQPPAQIPPKEQKPLKQEKKKQKTDKVYYNYPTHSYQYSTKENKKSNLIDKAFLKNNKYIALLLAGLAAVGLVLATNLDYIGFSLFGAVVLFFIIFEMWNKAVDCGLEAYLIALLILIFVCYSFIYLLKGGIFIFIGLGFLIIALFAIRETISWLSHKQRKQRL